ncbi:MAG: aminotransferase class V-fold PLP-dependent enzyme [Caldilineaceae bacterium]|nr:aminotransferase class V-fold PLP-dependent enzyme [Caldilineaceae bacterium]
MNPNDGEPAIRTIAQLRADLPLTKTYAYFQTGTFAPVPESTQRMMAAALQEENAQIIAIRGKEAGLAFYQRAEAARQTLADLLGVAAADVAWAYNTTAATRMAVSSFDWQRGDKIAVTDMEHLSTYSMVEGLQQRWGVETTVIPSGDGPSYTPDFFLAQLDRQLTPDHRLLIMSHVANIDGRRLPVKEATRIAASRGVKTLIDGAQSIGEFPVNVAEVGADFYSGSAHKWLMGPAGVGFLVVAGKQRPYYNPHFLPTRRDGEASHAVAPRTAGALSELGTPNYTLRLGAGHSVAILQQIGIAQSEQHMRGLSEHLRAGLGEISGVRLAGPRPWAFSSSITTLQLQDGAPERCQQLIARLLDDYRIVVKFRPEICGIRVTLAAFNNIEEVDRLLNALVRLASTS